MRLVTSSMLTTLIAFSTSAIAWDMPWDNDRRDRHHGYGDNRWDTGFDAFDDVWGDMFGDMFGDMDMNLEFSVRASAEGRGRGKGKGRGYGRGRGDHYLSGDHRSRYYGGNYYGRPYRGPYAAPYRHPGVRPLPPVARPGGYNAPPAPYRMAPPPPQRRTAPSGATQSRQSQNPKPASTSNPWAQENKMQQPGVTQPRAPEQGN
jgi:hypothetical protein